LSAAAPAVNWQSCECPHPGLRKAARMKKGAAGEGTRP